MTFDAQKIWPLYNSLTDIKKLFTQAVIDHHLKGDGNEFVKFLTSVEAAQADVDSTTERTIRRKTSGGIWLSAQT